MSCSFLKRHCNLEVQEFFVSIVYMNTVIFSYKLIKRDLYLLIFNYEEVQQASFLEAYLRAQRYIAFKNYVNHAYNYYPVARSFIKNDKLYTLFKIISLPYNLVQLAV